MLPIPVTLWGHWTCPYVNRVDGEYLADSIPILHFLEDRLLEDSADAPTLRPATNVSQIDKRVSLLDATLMRSMGGVAYGRDPEKIQRSSDFLNAAFSAMAEWLEESEWLAGDTPSLAEAIVVPVYLRLSGLRGLGR